MRLSRPGPADPGIRPPHGGSRAHCRSFDGMGAQLLHGGLATTTPQHFTGFDPGNPGADLSRGGTRAATCTADRPTSARFELAFLFRGSTTGCCTRMPLRLAGQAWVVPQHQATPLPVAAQAGESAAGFVMQFASTAVHRGAPVNVTYTSVTYATDVSLVWCLPIGGPVVQSCHSRLTVAGEVRCVSVDRQPPSALSAHMRRSRHTADVSGLGVGQSGISALGTAWSKSMPDYRELLMGTWGGAALACRVVGPTRMRPPGIFRKTAGRDSSLAAGHYRLMLPPARHSGAYPPRPTVGEHSPALHRLPSSHSNRR